MKNDSKKSHDSPKKVFLKRVDKSWLDSQVYVGREDKPFEGSSEYINLTDSWHSGKELPKSDDDFCLLDYASGLDVEVGHTYTDSSGFRGWLTDSGDHLFEEIVQWAYLEDIVPAKLKEGGKQ